MASPTALSPLETVMLVVREVLPASLRSCFAFSMSPVRGIFRVSGCLPPLKREPGMRAVAGSLRAGPPEAVRTASRSRAYCTARRTLTSSKGARPVCIWSISVQLVDSARSRALTSGLVSTLGVDSGRSLSQETAEASAPAAVMRRSSIWLALRPMVTTIRSGYALRTVSVEAFQWVLRTRTSCLSRAYDSILYGPEEKGRLSYCGPLSCALGTGAKVGSTVA